MRYNTDFRSAVRQYQLDLGAGRYDPTWLAEADAAMEERAQGKFDQWKEEQFEEFWGQKQKVDSKALAGQSSTVKLNRLIEADLCKVGDRWSYSRVFGQGKKKVLVEKEFKVCTLRSVSPNSREDDLLSFDTAYGDRGRDPDLRHPARHCEIRSSPQGGPHCRREAQDRNTYCRTVAFGSTSLPSQRFRHLVNPLRCGGLHPSLRHFLGLLGGENRRLGWQVQRKRQR